MRLPLLLSVPHAGLRVPEEVAERCLLSPEQIARDGDEGAAAVYLPLESEVAALVTTDVARAIVDLNRAEDDRCRDGVVKTHTCWDEPIYREELPPQLIELLLGSYHRPYHERLSRMAASEVLLGIDCHTMAAMAPPVGPDPGRKRPALCLSNADGTCPDDWLASLRDCLAESFGCEVKINDPFRGGYIIRRHSAELPWVQLELSRAPFLGDVEKSARILAALRLWCRGSQ